MSETWLRVPSGPGDPAFNMALDEVLLHSAREIGHPVLRFYGWTEPAASFGYFQRWEAIEKATLLRPLIRRPTGGGLVPHDADWTYSVVIPATHEWHRIKAKESYRRIHEWIQAALRAIGLSTELALECSMPAPGQCFAGHELHDVLWRGRKIAGAAQRRTRTGLLIQGSVQPPPLQLARDAWEEAMCEVLPAVWLDWQPSEAILQRCRELVRSRYGMDSYQRRR